MSSNLDEPTREVTRLWTLAQMRIPASVTAVIRDYRDHEIGVKRYDSGA